MREVLLKAFIIIVAIVLANWLFWHLVGLFTLTMAALAPLIILSAIVYFSFRYYRGRSLKFDKKGIYRLWNTSGKSVYVFVSEPSIDDILKISDELSLASLELEGQVFGVDNNTQVSVIEDEGSGAVKVKIADPQVREKVGWVLRETVIRARKQLIE